MQREAERSDAHAAALKAAARPMEPKPMPRVGLRSWLRTSEVPRRLVPSRVAVAFVAARGRLRWRRRPEEREDARRVMAAVVCGTRREPELERLARAYSIEAAIVRELLWRPWVTFDPLIGPETRRRLDAVVADPRGLIISNAHLGPVFGLLSGGVFPAPVFGVSGSWIFDRRLGGEWGRRTEQHVRLTMRNGTQLVEAKGSYPVLEALLHGGETVLLAFDMPGGRTTRFLGKPVDLATGTARLAHATGALVLPVAMLRRGHRVELLAAEPLDPADHASPDAIQDALAGVHERWILEHPEALEDPRRDGAWESGATPTAWTRPARDA